MSAQSNKLQTAKCAGNINKLWCQQTVELCSVRKGREPHLSVGDPRAHGVRQKIPTREDILSDGTDVELKSGQRKCMGTKVRRGGPSRGWRIPHLRLGPTAGTSASLRSVHCTGHKLQILPHLSNADVNTGKRCRGPRGGADGAT